MGQTQPEPGTSGAPSCAILATVAFTTAGGAAEVALRDALDAFCNAIMALPDQGHVRVRASRYDHGNTQAVYARAFERGGDGGWKAYPLGTAELT